MAQPQRRYSLDDYFAVEVGSTIKHEYYRGEIFAMAGASLAHNEITANVLTGLRSCLRGSRCRAYASDLRLATPGGLYTYPDVSVICGRAKTIRGRPDTVTNPVVLIEVLSDATREYDRGEKFELYKTIPTLRELLLIDQAQVSVERYQAGRGGKWSAKTHKRREMSVELASISVEIPLAEIYRDVDL